MSYPHDVIYVLYTSEIQQLEGEILTHLDAILTDPIQRKAAKDIVRPMIWSWAVRVNMADSHEIKRMFDGQIINNKIETQGSQLA